ncbi:MAG: hypothetical protein ACOX2J_08050 [Bacillota bacterium]
MVGKKRPKKIIMPSELRGAGRQRQSLSGPVTCYRLEDLADATAGPGNLLRGEKEDGLMSEEVLVLQQEDSTKEVPDLLQLPRVEQQRRLADLAAAGKNDEEIGNLFGLSQWQIRNLRYRLGVKKSRRGEVYMSEETATRSMRKLKESDTVNALILGAAPGTGLSVGFNGRCKSRELASLFAGLQALCAAQDEDKSFHITISMQGAE